MFGQGRRSLSRGSCRVADSQTNHNYRLPESSLSTRGAAREDSMLDQNDLWLMEEELPVDEPAVTLWSLA